MAIKKSNELDFSSKKISMLVTARPGTGKTTLALSAPKPLLIDLENGVDRVEACHRKDTMTADEGLNNVEKYNSFIKDLTTEDLSAYDTIIVDSLDKFFDICTDVVIRESAVNAQKDGKTLSLKGYGAVARKISDFIKLIKSLGKHIIFIGHTTEVNDGEVIKTRLNISGNTKNTIWNDIDLGGYMTFLGKKRVIYFTPTEQFDAKGTHGITGMYEIPELKHTNEGGQESDNHFLTDLFTVFINDLSSTKRDYEEKKVQYNEDMKLAETIKNATNLDELNAVVVELRGKELALTAKKELLTHCADKAKELNAVYDKEQGKYIANA